MSLRDYSYIKDGLFKLYFCWRKQLCIAWPLPSSASISLLVVALTQKGSAILDFATNPSQSILQHLVISDLSSLRKYIKSRARVCLFVSLLLLLLHASVVLSESIKVRLKRLLSCTYMFSKFLGCRMCRFPPDVYLAVWKYIYTRT